MGLRVNNMDLTWHCEICHEERPDKKISVITYSLKKLSNAERNLKYCNDNPDCINKANLKAQTGEI